jgi:hypothetical protein
MLFNVYLHDIMTCHKAVRTSVFRRLPLREDGFAIEPEIAARLVQSGHRIFEVPVHYKARASSEGKKLTARDGLRVLRTLTRCRVSLPPSSLRSGGFPSVGAVERPVWTTHRQLTARALERAEITPVVGKRSASTTARP